MQLINSFKYIHRAKLYVNRNPRYILCRNNEKYDGIIENELGLRLAVVITEERGPLADVLVK